MNDFQRIPDWLCRILEAKTLSTADSDTGKIIKEGMRNDTLTSIAGYLRSKGIVTQSLTQILELVNETSLEPPLNPFEVKKIANSINSYETIQWEDPIPLPALKHQLTALKPEHLPSGIKNWLVDLSERMQVPLEFVAAPSILATATLIGRKVTIKPLKNDDWTVVPNLWGFLVAEPGSMKSPALNSVMKLLDDIERKSRKIFQKECASAQRFEKSKRSEIETLKQSLKLDFKSDFLDAIVEKQNQIMQIEEEISNRPKLIEKRYKTNDPTVEKLALLLKDNPQGILLLRDELSGWLDSLSRAGREGNREFYLETWSGNSSFSVDRIGRGSTYVEALCLSIFGGIQPAKLQNYIDKTTTESGDDGFLERFQIVFFPETRKRFNLIDRKPDEHASQTACEIFEFLDSLPMDNSLNFSHVSQTIADKWRCELEERILKDKMSPMLRAHLGKYRSLMPSLALIFCLLKNANTRGIPTSVDEEATRMAIDWCSLLEGHLSKIYSTTIHDPLHSARILAKKIEKRMVYDGEKIRDIARHNWSNLKTSESICKAIEELSAFHWVKLQTRKSRGGDSDILLINPRLKLDFGASHE